MKGHFEPLRPNRFHGTADRYEFTHGVDSVCVYDISTLNFIKEIPVGPRPDCHATSCDNRYLYMACGDGLYVIDQESLSIAGVVDTGHVYATNVMPDGETMLLHDAYGGMFILKGINDIQTIRIHKRIDVLKTNTLMDTLGGKGHFIGDGRFYLCAAWEHAKLFLIDLQDDYSSELFMDYDESLYRGDDLVINAEKTKAYIACHHAQGYVAVVDIYSHRITKLIQTGFGTCGLTMINDERYVVASNDGDNSISIIDTQTDNVERTLSVVSGLDELGTTGLIQGISIGVNDEVYVYGCSGSGALARFSDITGTGEWAVATSTGLAIGKD